MKAPVEMPTLYIGQQQFELQRVDYTAASADGRVSGVQAGFPLWSGVWTLTRMPADNSDEWRAWFVGQRGAIRRFYARDISRPYPKAWGRDFAGLTRAGGGSFDGTATSWSETINSDDDSEVTLNGLPIGFVLSVGDYIGYEYSATETAVSGQAWSCLTRVTVGGTANGSGVVTVTCEPPIPSAVPDDATATLNKPKCVMALVSDQSSLQATDVMKSIQGGQVVGIQDIRS